MTENLAFLTAQQLLDGYRSGAFSPVEAVEAVLARIDTHNPAINAFMLVDHDGARAGAQASAARWRSFLLNSIMGHGKSPPGPGPAR